MPVIKKFVQEEDESISMEIFSTNEAKIEFYLRNENCNESIFIDLNYEDIDLIIERLFEIKLELGQTPKEGGTNV